LQTRTQVSLSELLEARPLQQGLAELVAYLQLASEQAKAVMDESTMEPIEWLARDGEEQLVKRLARMPRVIFVRN
jgi:hypothetical protein